MLVVGRVQLSVGQSGRVVLTEKRALDETWREWVGHVDIWRREIWAEETGSANGSREECSWQEWGNSRHLISVAGVQGWGKMESQGEWGPQDLVIHCNSFCFYSGWNSPPGNQSWRVPWSGLFLNRITMTIVLKTDVQGWGDKGGGR